MGFSIDVCASIGFVTELDDSVISVVIDSVELNSNDDSTKESIKQRNL